MEILTSFTAAKAGVELVTALAALAEAAKQSKHPSVQEILQKLHGEAIRSARALESSLDEMSYQLDVLKVDLGRPLRDIEHDISTWNLPKRFQYNTISKRLWRTATGLKDFYADIEAVFACSEQQQSLEAGIDRAYEMRNELDKALANSSVSELIAAMRKAVYHTLTLLEGNKA